MIKQTWRAAVSAAVIAASTMAANADVVCSIDGNTMTVTASSSYAGKGLWLLWDSSDKGNVVADWSHSALIVDNVPAGGGTLTVDLAALGITNGTPCRVVSCSRYARLNMLKQSGYKSYINSGIYDHVVYGVRFGYYSVAKNIDGAACIGSAGGKGGFVVYANGSTRATVSVVWRGTALSEHPSVSYGQPSDAPDTSKINEFAFTNGVFTLNGVTVNSSLETGIAVGNAKLGIRIGTSQADAGNKAMYGWWSHVSFDGADGSLIRDYIPVMRTTDNMVGFFDRVSNTFASSEGTDAFAAGTPTGETVYGNFNMETETITHLGLSARRSTLTITVPQHCVGGHLMVLWDDSDKGDDVAAWAHSAAVADNIAAGTYTVRMSALGIRNGQLCRVVACQRYYPLDMLLQDSHLSYINPGFYDYEVYGVRFGYYSVSLSANSAACMGSAGSKGGFVVYANSDSRATVSVKWRGTELPEHPGVSCGQPSDAPDTSKINEFAFTNGVFTLNGATVNSSLGTDIAVGNAKLGIRIGTSQADAGNKAMYGWWSHVSFDDADGNKILDYIPVKRAVDDAVGFWDRATKKFVTSSGTGGFAAGSVKDAPPVLFTNAADTFRVSTIPGIVLIVK